MQSVGIDLVNINRFDKLKDKDKFINKIFTNNELVYINKHNNSNETVAGIYSSKEAFLKAIKKGINNYSLKDIEVLHDDNGAPYITLHNELKELYKDLDISLSISHDGEYATSVVIINIKLL